MLASAWSERQNTIGEASYRALGALAHRQPSTRTEQAKRARRRSEQKIGWSNKTRRGQSTRPRIDARAEYCRWQEKWSLSLKRKSDCRNRSPAVSSNVKNKEQGPILLQSKEIKPDTESAENYREEVAEPRNRVLRHAQKNQIPSQLRTIEIPRAQETRFWWADWEIQVGNDDASQKSMSK
jgi:hypothetical protein